MTRQAVPVPRSLVVTMSGTTGHFYRTCLTEIQVDSCSTTDNIGALSAYGTIAGSDYHAGTLSIRQRFKGLTWDLNYTFSKSIDDASGVQTSGVFGTAFIHNALRAEDNRAVSDFDVRHILNFNSVWELPVGRGKMLNGMNKIADAFLGGWQISNVLRYNTGFPISMASWISPVGLPAGTFVPM